MDEDTTRLPKGYFYILLSFVFWVIVEYITVWHARFEEWMSYMPYILIQYLCIVLIFYLVTFIAKWSEIRVFAIMLVVMYVFELLWMNPYLYDIFLFVPGSLLLISIWGFLTFNPLWILQKSIKDHKVQMIFYSIWIIYAAFLLMLLLLSQ